MGICCQKPIAIHNSDTYEQPQIEDLERPLYSSGISAGIHSEDLYGNMPEEVIDTQIYEIFHTPNIFGDHMNISLLEKNDLVNINIATSYNPWGTFIDIDGWQHVIKK